MFKIPDKTKVAELFHQALSEPGEGQAQLDFMEARPLSDETIKEWNIGYCPPHIPHYPGFFPYLKGRIIIPFYDVYGDLLCFFGRRLESDAEKVLDNYMQEYTEALDMFYKWDSSKWINEPYAKSNNLFGFYNNKKEILSSGYAIIVEGNYDVICLYDHGIRNAVATCGSQVFGNTQVALLSRYTRRIVILSDADSAGDIGKERIKNSLVPYNFDVYTGILPAKDDPEDFVRRNGGTLIKDAIERAFANSEKEIIF